jgi:hypothetical protein
LEVARTWMSPSSTKFIPGRCQACVPTDSCADVARRSTWPAKFVQPERARTKLRRLSFRQRCAAFLTRRPEQRQTHGAVFYEPLRAELKRRRPARPASGRRRDATVSRPRRSVIVGRASCVSRTRLPALRDVFHRVSMRQSAIYFLGLGLILSLVIARLRSVLAFWSATISASAVS